VLTVDVFRAILSHSGMLLRDKLKIHRTPKPQSQLVRQLTSYRSYTHLNELRADDPSTPEYSSSETPSRMSTDSLPAPTLRHTPSTSSISRSGTGYLSPLSNVHQRHGLSDDEKSGGKLSNALTRHFRDISHFARHRDGIGDESEESSQKKARLLFGKFGGK
jgi:hypothetical protein